MYAECRSCVCTGVLAHMTDDDRWMDTSMDGRIKDNDDNYEIKLKRTSTVWSRISNLDRPDDPKVHERTRFCLQMLSLYHFQQLESQSRPTRSQAALKKHWACHCFLQMELVLGLGEEVVAVVDLREVVVEVVVEVVEMVEVVDYYLG